MRARLGAACVLAVLATMTGGAGAATAKPIVWLTHLGSEHAAPGSPAKAYLRIQEPAVCEAAQEASVAVNGKPTDSFAVAPSESLETCGSEKLAGLISSLTVKGSGEAASMTVKGTFHVLVEPWCVYALPKTITLPLASILYGEATTTMTLDRSASFGTCSASRPQHVKVEVEDTPFFSPFYVEVLG